MTRFNHRTNPGARRIRRRQIVATRAFTVEVGTNLLKVLLAHAGSVLPRRAERRRMGWR